MHQVIVAILLGLGFASATLLGLHGVIGFGVAAVFVGLGYYLSQAGAIGILGMLLLAILPMIFYGGAFAAGALAGSFVRAATTTRRSWRAPAVVVGGIAVVAFSYTTVTNEKERQALNAETQAKAFAAATALVSSDPRVTAITGEVLEIPLKNPIENREARKLLGARLYVKGRKGDAMVETMITRGGDTPEVRIVSVQASK
jgi:MFS family permease